MATIFFCTECGFETGKWSGKCPACGAWGTLKESTRVTGKNNKPVETLPLSKPERIIDLEYDEFSRLLTGIKEFDLVLGGGIVKGMLILIGGEPGIGKSTLMLQLSEWMGKQNKKTLYCSGEESAEQIRLRSKHLKVTSENIYLLCTNNAEHIIEAIEDNKPDLAIVDSIQSVSIPSLDALPGTVTQLRETTSRLLRTVKNLGIPLFLVGHVTKEGLVAGPKIIEHMVDTVLYFEGEQRSQYKILRAVKNRFGSTNEIGLFEMTHLGLIEVSNPNNIFLSHEQNNIGTAISCIMEGSRSFIVEVQTLVNASNYGTPQRVAVGLDQKKLAMLLAILEKNLSLYLRNCDVFVNLTGGIRSTDPSLDLAILAALISSMKDQPLIEKAVFIGEVGLNGEVRPVSQLDKHISQTLKLGYEKIFISSYAKVKANPKVVKVKDIKALYSALR
ncbi:DNA repair protein RadA [Candidatus Cloacimonas acidaminovorans]|uniref:DNA repair protein RadA n=1 Tax=Cloacimonas acidaminovorans (strain Evry) TaxID=459349 RepID=B0VEX2_CLOAI|nr:DNA repair protein RadA [Candidatus Cloacimonas acidaminovorans]CAO80593.1 DNA repair protein radA homolog (DNA repair protein sms homolog); putative ATP-dependent protease, with nucleoside triP hydrolase and multiheme cytochrome domains [Candidatus Cloacimonas acidaminovorans str. Evry]